MCVFTGSPPPLYWSTPGDIIFSAFVDHVNLRLSTYSTFSKFFNKHMHIEHEALRFPESWTIWTLLKRQTATQSYLLCIHIIYHSMATGHDYILNRIDDKLLHQCLPWLFHLLGVSTMSQSELFYPTNYR